MSRSCVILLLPVLLWISLSDIRTMEIPDTGWFIIALLAVMTRPFWLYGAGVFLLLLPFSMKDLLGFGDVKLCTAMALLAGWRTVIVLETASLLALLFFAYKKGSCQKIPFAPFLCSGFLAALLC
ncbi:MAG: prepilin peptidase [Erysipelotrichaceae bacterium]|nr:prepilin peptidase [Erysipelotrichaceae bacterium]